jgi:alpha-beta hydrolase superfamily lysophospholipase
MHVTGSMLHTARLGPAEGRPYLVLHDRYGSLEDARTLGRTLAPEDANVLAIQAPRLQTVGGVGKVQGYYWYVGPRERAELTSLGDSLFHLEHLMLEAAKSGQKVTLVGAGEGGTMALLTAMTWPEKIAEIIALDAALPLNFARIPIEWPAPGGLKVTLVGKDPSEFTTDLLVARGVALRLVPDATALGRPA